MRSYREKTGISCTAKEIFDEARKGGTPERETVEEFIDYLSEGIADIVNILRPEIVAIGGGLSGASDLFIEKVSALVNEKIFGGKFLPVEVVAAKLQNDAGIIGATLLDK
jgi:glucokinase